MYSGNAPTFLMDKIIFGVIIFAAIMLILVLPVVMFSSLNPSLNRNPVMEVQMELSVQACTRFNISPQASRYIDASCMFYQYAGLNGLRTANLVIFLHMLGKLPLPLSPLNCEAGTHLFDVCYNVI